MGSTVSSQVASNPVFPKIALTIHFPGDMADILLSSLIFAIFTSEISHAMFSFVAYAGVIIDSIVKTSPTLTFFSFSFKEKPCATTGLTFTLHVEVIEDSNPARAVIVASPAFSAVTITELSLPDSKLAISELSISQKTSFFVAP